MTDAESLLNLPPTPPEVKRYQRQKLTAGLASTFLTFAVLLALALVGGTLFGPWADDCPWLRLAVVALVCAVAIEVVTLPLHYYSGYVLEHRYGLSNQSFGRWLWRLVKGYLVAGIIGLPLLYGLYALLRLTEPWWLWAALGWLGVTVVLGRLLPVVVLPLFYKVTALDDARLRQRLEGLAAGTGLTLEGVYRLHLSADTKKANAALAGLGKTRRVLLGDTLLDQFSEDEIAVVFAHEVGHHVYRHLPKMIACSVALAVAGFWLVDVALRAAAGPLRLAAFNDPAGLPLVLLVLALFGLAVAPLENAISRRFERQCDRYALERTAAPDVYRSAFVKLARLNKSDPDPNPLVVWLFHDHPPIRERLAAADVPLPGASLS